MRTYPRWLGIAILLVIATFFALNHVAARVAFDHGTSVVTGVVFRSGGTALALLALLFILRTPIRLSKLTTRRALLQILFAGISNVISARYSIIIRPTSLKTTGTGMAELRSPRVQKSWRNVFYRVRATPFPIKM